MKRYPGALTLIAGPRTNHYLNDNSAPLIYYPFHGDFDAHVRVVADLVRQFDVVGLSVRSQRDRNAWVSLVFVNDGRQPQYILVQKVENGNSVNGNFVHYPDNDVYLRLERQGSLYNFLYSADGKTWNDLQHDFIFGDLGDVDINLVVYATHDFGLLARFYDFSVIRR